MDGNNHREQLSGIRCLYASDDLGIAAEDPGDKRLLLRNTSGFRCSGKLFGSRIEVAALRTNHRISVAGGRSQLFQRSLRAVCVRQA